MKANRNSNVIRYTAGALALGLLAGPAGAQFSFEGATYPASPAGTPLAPSGGWYIPLTDPLGINFKTFTYPGNALGLAYNPYGASQFISGSPPATAGTFARVEHAVSFQAVNIWTICYDVAVLHTGTAPANDPVGSFSLQPSATSRYCIESFTWMSTATPTAWKIGFSVFSAAGAGPTGVAPVPAWTSLAVNHWYRVRTVVNFSSNNVMTVALTDLSTSLTTTYSPPPAGAPGAWYLAGGLGGGTLPIPSAIRLFAGGAGGGIPGNNVCIDNISISQGNIHCEPCYANCDASTTAPVLNVLDFACFLNKFAAGDAYANCDGSTTPPVLNVLDFACFLNRFAAGCP